MQDCDGCKRVEAAKAGSNPHCIAEFENSWLFLGDHQYYRGYCVLMAKAHARELQDMPEKIFMGLAAELMRATRAIDAAFKPWKMNHACLGNLVQHVHWHIMPRYEDDADRFHNPWFNMAAFASKVPEDAEREALVAKIRSAL